MLTIVHSACHQKALVKHDHQKNKMCHYKLTLQDSIPCILVSLCCIIIAAAAAAVRFWFQIQDQKWFNRKSLDLCVLGFLCSSLCHLLYWWFWVNLNSSVLQETQNTAQWSHVARTSCSWQDSEWRDLISFMGSLHRPHRMKNFHNSIFPQEYM